MPGPEKKNYCSLNIQLFQVYIKSSVHLYFICTFVFSQWISWPESPFTDVARDRDPFQMVWFNVISNANSMSFLSTHFASFSSLFSTWNQVLAFLHHRFHLFVKLLDISKRWQCHCSLIVDICSWTLFFFEYIFVWLCKVCVHKLFRVYRWFGYQFHFSIGWICVYLLVLFFLIIVLSRQSFKFKFFSNCKKWIQIFLVDICLTTVLLRESQQWTEDHQT